MTQPKRLHSVWLVPRNDVVLMAFGNKKDMWCLQFDGRSNEWRVFQTTRDDDSLWNLTHIATDDYPGQREAEWERIL